MLSKGFPIVAMLLGVVFTTHSSLAANNLDSGSDKILKSMSSYMAVDLELTYDCKTLAIFSAEKNAYLQLNEPGSVDDAMDAVRNDLGLDIAGADLLYADPYPGLVSGVTSSSYLGTAFLDGIEVHHLAFRENQLDWQLWVKADGEPLPLKYVITTKMMVAAPQYSVRYRDWNTNSKINATQFNFSVPAGAKNRTILPINEIRL